MLERLAEAFEARFRRSPERAARAPGRVNLIGEHTDYNEGLVLPCALDRETWVVGAARRDRLVRVFSLDLPAEASLSLEAPRRRGDFSDYVIAPWTAIGEGGRELPGADLGVVSRVPLEAGLSSSAALGVGVAWVLDRLYGLGLAPEELAAAVHRGENAFVGVGCGILDQYASALGRRDHALRIDCRDRALRWVPLGPGAPALLLAHSGVRRALATGGYGERVRECAEALEAARRAGIAAPDARALRDLAVEDLPALERALPPLLLRRARHVIRENRRVDDFCVALEAARWADCGALLREGMASLRGDYDVSTPELDLLCELADGHPAVYGSRLTGAGWGGCTLHLVREEALDEVQQALRRGFARRFGREPTLWRVRPADGAAEVPLTA